MEPEEYARMAVEMHERRWAEFGRGQERTRLEQEVIRAAKEFKIAWVAWLTRSSSALPASILEGRAAECRIKLCDSVDALIEFENQK